METAKHFLAEQTKQGGKGKKTRPQEALAKVPLQLLALSGAVCIIQVLAFLEILLALS